MTRNVRAVLDVVEDALIKGGQDAQDLMNLLSALRGPDGEDDVLKRKTTAPIRSMIFPRLAASLLASDHAFFPVQGNNGWLMGRPSDLDVNRRSRRHFSSHITWALEALNRKDE